MQRVQAADGSWTPLWFGDQDAKDERSPIYGTAMAVEYLSSVTRDQVPATSDTWSLVAGSCNKGLQYILSAQNADGGWGGAKDIPSKVTLTARALSALASFPEAEVRLMYRPRMEKACDFLYQKYINGELYQREPIGLYFSRLWYSEEMYNITFVLNGLKKFSKL